MGLGLGCIFGGAMGASSFSVLGGVVGAITGGYAGLVVGSLPEFFALRSLARDIGGKTSGELREYLHREECKVPNVVLLELKRRGEEIRSELSVVLDLLVSENMDKQSRGWAALESAFPELAQQIPQYCIGGSPDACREQVELLRTMSQPAD